MSSLPESRKTRAHTSDIDLAKLMSESKRVLRNPTISSFFTTFRRQEQTVQEEITTLDAPLRPDYNCLPFMPEHGKPPALESLSQF